MELDTITVDFSTIAERDMDMMFINAFASDESFVRLFTDKAGIKATEICVMAVQRSKTDSDGESDITVKINADGRKIGLLIEDKIDAPATNEQHKRYGIRAKKAVKAGEFDEYRLFILCPYKYYSKNTEAKKYENIVTYEECLEYFEINKTEQNYLRVQQILQALNKVKTRTVTFNEKRNGFLKKYIEYANENFPEIESANKVENCGSGGWTRFRTELKNSHIMHKGDFGCVDLTFSEAGSKMIYMEVLEGWIRKWGFNEISAVRTAKSAAFRIEVPVIDFDEDFENCTSRLDEIFKAVSRLTELAKIIGYFSKICEK